jgi:hypothetical protein
MEYWNMATKVDHQKYHKITMETPRNNTVMEATKEYRKWNIGILQYYSRTQLTIKNITNSQWRHQETVPQWRQQRNIANGISEYCNTIAEHS